MQSRARTNASNSRKSRVSLSSSLASAGATPTHVSPIVLASIRAEEIASLEGDLTGTSGAARGFQRLPRYLRRRTMSHNPRRLPRRLRGLGYAEMMTAAGKKGKHATPREAVAAAVALTKSRRTRRKPAGFAQYKNRASKNVWLETHIWHAKRMAMADSLWKSRIPLAQSMRSQRAALKAARHAATVRDISFYGVLVVSLSDNDSDSEGPHPLACCLADPSTIPLLTSLPFTSSGQTLHVTLTLPPSGHMLGPATLFHINSTTIWGLIHPALLPAVRTELLPHLPSSSSLRPPTSLCVFELDGPRSHAVLGKACLPHTPALARSLSSPDALRDAVPAWALLSSLTSTHTAGALPDNALLALHVSNPRLGTPHKARSAGATSASASRKAMWSQNGGKPPVPSMGPSLGVVADIHEYQRSGMYADADARNDLADWDAWDPSTHTPATVAEVNALRSRVLGGDVLSWSVAAADANSPIAAPIPILLLLNKTRTGYTLVAPRGYGMAFLLALVYNGARVIGLDDAAIISTERGSPFFPHDYVETETYRDWVQNRGAAAAKRHGALPPSKRPNYPLLGSPYPFFPNWHALATHSEDDDLGLVSCSFELVSKGSMVANTYVCLPTLGDLGELESPPMEPTHREFHTRKVRKTPGGKNHGKRTSMVRPLVGYVTSALYSPSRGAPFGLGTLALSSLSASLASDLMSGRSITVLLRVPTSRQYRFAVARPLRPT